MTTGLSDNGSFGGVFFFLSSHEVRESFHNETIEYVTDHPPEPILYKKAPREFAVSGFLFGSGSVLARDLLAKVCKEREPKLLFLPLLGFLSCVCASFSFSESDSDPGLIRLDFLFKEIPQRPPFWGSQMLEKVEALNDIVDSYALKVIAILEPIAQTSYGIKRLTDCACKISSVLTSLNGFGLFSGAIGDARSNLGRIEELVQSPKNFVEDLTSAIKSLDDSQATQFLARIGSFEIAQVLTLISLSILEKITGEKKEKLFAETIDKLPTDESYRLMQIRDEVFSRPKPIPTRKLKEPTNLVLASFLSGTLQNEDDILLLNDNVFNCPEVPI